MTGDSLTALAVELRFDGDADGETVIALPDKWAGTPDLWKAVSDVTATGGTVTGDGATRVIRHGANAPLLLRYRLASNGAAEPGPNYHKAQPVVRPGWFFFHGEGLFAVPQGRDQAAASFRWAGWPSGWKVASDLDHLAARPGTVEDIVESAGIGSPDLQLIERQVDGAPFRLAMRGTWTFEPAILADRVAAVMHAENGYWGDKGRAFFVPVAPMVPEGLGRSTNGTGRTDGFAIASTTNYRLEDASQFLAHEYMHSWLPREIGGGLKENEAEGYWLNEGFVDFTAARALVRSGIWSIEEYAKSQNEVLMRLATSPARNLDNKTLGARFWSDGSAQQMPYDRGNIFALWLDAKLAAKGGVDAVLRRQRQMAKVANSMGAPLLFPTAAREATGVDVRPDIARHIDRGEPVTLPPKLGCLEVKTVERPAFHRGFDIDATTPDDVIRGTDPKGNAYAAGLRDGMKLIRREGGEIGNPAVEIAYRVGTESGEKVLRWLPLAPAPVRLQQLIVPTLDEVARKACAARL
ncbi:hypothetical protein ACFOMD_02725 [Sphingoaurantiacus capsulatus]|uniref:Peptidase M61 catalytic domain-containing protein n=1 Tax=Sphingoaurantiacus capsulatus TaxID=1771310 RepID=A0ABV7X875_9SPHN